QAGLALPAAAGLTSQGGLNAVFQGSPKVEYRTLGKTGLKVSSVGYGIGFNPVAEVVSKALDMGINYFDTARSYADSEKVFAGLIKGRKRDSIVMATKSSSRTKEAILKDMDTSLSVLGMDYVDIWHLHGLDTWPNIPDEAVEAKQECKKSGKARFIGFSCHDPNKMVDFVLKTKTFDVIQPTYSFAIGAYYRDAAIKRLHDAGVGIIAMKVVVALSGLNLKSVDNPTARPNGDGPVAGIKWVLNNPAISTTVPFMRTIPELEMNFRAMSEPYTDADEKLLFVLNEQIRPYYCRMCYSCSGVCPKGLPVADMLRFLAYNDFAGNYYQAKSNFRELAKEIRDVRCSDCSACAIQCPNGVQVQSRLCRAQELLA
ncbi:MAG: aldo/keto reductase, partial [Acidobacteriota bacterium]|nr:aldo/keto reductase [Acidobacteriota bacterium]